MVHVAAYLTQKLCMKRILALLLLPLATFCQDTADVVIRNGKIIDGTGNAWYYGDVAIKNGLIWKTGKLDKLPAYKTVDATGLYVCPGFIDVHTHLEEDERKSPRAANFIYDGVTTCITGNCGASDTDMAHYFAFIDSVRLSINVAALVGHNDVRKKVMGRAMRTPTDTELQQMKALVAKAMQDGALGLSTGLIYIPGTYSTTDEITALAQVAATYNGVYATHMRDEGDSVAYAINEALEIGRRAGIPVQISHFKVGGQQNWGRSKETLAMIVKAREAGIEVTIDQYPYTASSTSLSTLLPEWVLADGHDSINARLSRPALRKQVKQKMLANLAKRKLQHYSYVVVSAYEPKPAWNGKSIEAINLLNGRKHTAADEAETILQMMELGGAAAVFHGMSEADVKYIMQYPFCMIASDATIRVPGQGSPHPRGYGTNARVLGKYSRDEKVLGLEEAIRRMTSLPAQKFRLPNRGLLLPGYAADVLVLDAARVQDNASFEQPHQYATGIPYVWVNGALTVENGQHTGARNGQALKRQD